MITVAIADDHQLFVKSLGLMLATFKQYKVVVEASNGKDLIEKLAQKNISPDIILLDVNMPQMDGYETAKWLQIHQPNSKIVALSMNDGDEVVIKMMKAGCCAYFLKDTHPNELEKALEEIVNKGYYNGDVSNINYRRLMLAEKELVIVFAEKEINFLQFACSDLTYKQIAGEMKISDRAVETLRENLFVKMNVQSRVGLCLEAIRRKLVHL